MVAVQCRDVVAQGARQDAEIIGFLDRLDEGRAAVRAALRLPCWLMEPDQSRRGFVSDLSSTGARVSGMRPVAIGTRLLCKVDFGRHGGPLTTFAQVVRHHGEGPGAEAGLLFLDPPFGFWNLVNQLSIRAHQRHARRRRATPPR